MSYKGRIDIVTIVIYIVAVYVATIAIQIYQPVTGGYFNLGEAVIYLAAILHGPIVAALAGGIGASLADLSTGYGIFAPATAVIKFIEGYFAGWLIWKFRDKARNIKAAVGALIGALYTLLLIFFAIYYWSGPTYVGPEQFLSLTITSAYLEIPVYVWIIIVLVIGASLSYVLVKKLVTAWEPLALIFAGLEMVIGYFLYEYFVSNPLTGRQPVAAIVEIPVNIGQAVIGASIAVPLASWLVRAGYGRGKSD
ncbi:ECF transporter S component [Staphylothermus hellenicus]|uniref:ECF transporter S component n=1 Tax=Staphylothermus hellenicus (strain DSM 12710 / JCM 10830 / BK20S6-10-b1 / P8) TaxID=591019 RepID=D7DC66_STAHD|nr:ECF transporter S component [Staphylothermus hellenicus]ADI31763.1 protein of unknown function DUF1393 [Staphylothermus hellenicus DSM 12710]